MKFATTYPYYIVLDYKLDLLLSIEIFSITIKTSLDLAMLKCTISYAYLLLFSLCKLNDFQQFNWMQFW